MTRRGGASGNRRLSARLVSEPVVVIQEVRAALMDHGNVSEAARQLGIGARTLFRWIKRYPQMLEGVKR